MSDVQLFFVFEVFCIKHCGLSHNLVVGSESAQTT